MKPIDIRIVEQLRDMEARGRPGLMDKLARSFAEVSVAGITAVHDAFERRDGEAMWRAAHKLRSGATAIGAKRVAARCAAIEKAGRAATFVTIAGHVGRLEVEVSVALAWLRILAAAPAVTDRWPAARRA
jgi:HPt (histidine-containing phosphotransfer) domain-containing protein